jgi:mono/diheme cytochrome c family protein
MSKSLKTTRPLLVLALAGVLAAVSSGCGTTTASVDRGRTLFIQNCGTCHQMAQAGTTAQVGPNLDSAFAAARAAGETGDTIEGVVKSQVGYPRPDNGNPTVSMPADIVTGQDLEDVAAYVAEYAGVPGAAPPKVPGGPGAQVFANNGCGGCHVLAAANSAGVTGPNLDKALAPDDNAASIKPMIVDPNSEIVPGYPANVMPQDYGTTITAIQLNQLVQYLIDSTPASGGSSSSTGQSSGGKSGGSG